MNDNDMNHLHFEQMDEELEELLGEWSQCHQMTPIEAETIHTSIVEEGNELTELWWNTFFSILNHSITASNRLSNQSLTRTLKMILSNMEFTKNNSA